MSKLVLFIIPVALLAASEGDKAKPAKDSKPAQTSSQPASQSGSITIPPDAVQLSPQVYRYKDADGKVWIYRRTPFGISKMEDRSGDQAASAVPAKSKIKVQAFDKGDTVRFEQQTPMGPRVWERKKSELSAEEKAWLDETKAGNTESAKPEK